MIMAIPRTLRCPYNNVNGIETLKKVGIKVLEQGEYYIYTRLPESWTWDCIKRKILDQKKRVRMRVFYDTKKEPHAYTEILPRFIISHFCDYDKNTVVAKVLDSNGVVIFETEPAEFFEETNHKSELIASSAAGKLCFVWLMRNYPDWQDLAAYWD